MTAIRFRSPLLRLLPRRVCAVAWDGVVHVRGDAVSPLVLAHEREHLRQQARDGRWRFLWRYAWYALRGRENPYEQEADREAAAQFLIFQ